MKIVLIKPSWEFPLTRSENTYNRYWPPLSLMNCAAILERAGHEATIIDAHAERLAPNQVAIRAKDYDVALVTSSDLDRWQCPNLELEPLRRLISALQKIVPRIFLTGFHSTVAPEEMLRTLGVSAVVRGEPESSVLELVQATKLSGVLGVSYLEGGSVHHNPDSLSVNMQNLPMPAFSKVDFKRYRYEILGSPFSLLESVRGCPYPCTYCARPVQGKSFRRKSTDQFIEEVEELSQKFRIPNAYIIDLEFTASRSHVVAICETMIRKNIKLKWTCQTRADQVDREILNLMKKAGCRLIHFGVESGSQRVLDRMKKNTTVAIQQAGVKMAQKLGFQTLCFFLYGYPGETEQDRFETLRFAKSLNPTYAAFHRVTPYLETPHFKNNVSSQGVSFPLYHGSAEERAQMENWVAKSTKAFYFRPTYIIRRLLQGNFSSLFGQLRLFFGYLRVFSSGPVTS